MPVGETTASAGSSRPSSPALVRLKSAYCLTVLCSASPASQSTGTYPHRGNKGGQDTGNVPVSLTAALTLAPVRPNTHLPRHRRSRDGGMQVYKRPHSHLRHSDVVLARLTISSHPSWQYRGQPRQREWHLIRLAAESAGVSVAHPRRPGRTIVCSFIASGLGLPRTGLASRRAKTCFYCVWAPPRRPPSPPSWEKGQIRGLLL